MKMIQMTPKEIAEKYTVGDEVVIPPNVQIIMPKRGASAIYKLSIKESLHPMMKDPILANIMQLPKPK